MDPSTSDSTIAFMLSAPDTLQPEERETSPAAIAAIAAFVNECPT